MPEIRAAILAHGHQNILALHPSTLMITKEQHLTQTGDCIVAVGADKAVADLSPQLKDALRKPGAELIIIIEADGLKVFVNASGSPKLTLTHPTDLVIRKSEYISDRTLAINSDKSSLDLPRELINKLKNPCQEIKIEFVVH